MRIPDGICLSARPRLNGACTLSPAADRPMPARIACTSITGMCTSARCLLAHRQSPSPHQLRKRTRTQGFLLRRHCTASTLIRPCPTPALAATCRNVEAATLADDGSPAITRTTIPTCRAHYHGGSSGCACRLLPHSCSLPQMAGGSASALSLSRPAQASHVLRPTGSLRRPLSRGSNPFRAPGRAARQLPDQSTILLVDSSSTSDSRLRAHCQQRTYDAGGVDLGLAVASRASTAVTSRSAISRVAACARVELHAT